MNLDHTNMVTPDNGPRPAGKPDECFYCRRHVGQEHTLQCVCRKKVVMVQVTLTIPRVVPASWEASTIGFAMNEGTWCADNIVSDLGRYMDAKDEEEAPCLCNRLTGKYLRDATEEDLQGLDLVKLSED